MTPRYSLPEIERRWRVNPDLLPDLPSLPKRVITDKYLTYTRLRLRKIESENEVVYKLCKKYGKVGPITEPITNLYLSEAEYLTLFALEGRLLIRERYTLVFEGHTFSLNLKRTQQGAPAPIILEAEFKSEAEARAAVPPDFCTEEVSNNPRFEAVKFTDAATP